MANCGTKLWLGNQEAFSGDYHIVHGIPGNWIGRKPENGGNATTPMDNIALCLTGADRHGVAYGFQPRIARNGRGDMGDVCHALTAQAGETGKGDSAPCVAVIHGTQDPCNQSELSFALGRNNGGENVVFPAVRRLTPIECERLQGFPDGHTNIPNAADGNRYKALGNSKAVPVVQWIGKRILKELNHDN